MSILDGLTDYERAMNKWIKLNIDGNLSNGIIGLKADSEGDNKAFMSISHTFCETCYINTGYTGQYDTCCIRNGHKPMDHAVKYI